MAENQPPGPTPANTAASKAGESPAAAPKSATPQAPAHQPQTPSKTPQHVLDLIELAGRAVLAGAENPALRPAAEKGLAYAQRVWAAAGYPDLPDMRPAAGPSQAQGGAKQSKGKKQAP